MLAELQPVWELLEQYFDQAHKLIDGLTIEQLNWRPIEGETQSEATNSLYGIALHIAFISMRLSALAAGRQAAFYPEMQQGNTGITAVGDSPARAVELLDEARAFVRESLESLTAEQMEEMRERRAGNWSAPPKSVRWIVLHILDHVALHVGHMEITRQLVMKKTGGA